MTQSGGKRKVNPVLKAWIAHVRKVSTELGIPYGKEAMKKAKHGKYGHEWTMIKKSLKKVKRGGDGEATVDESEEEVVVDTANGAANGAAIDDASGLLYGGRKTKHRRKTGRRARTARRGRSRRHH